MVSTLHLERPGECAATRMLARQRNIQKVAQEMDIVLVQEHLRLFQTLCRTNTFNLERYLQLRNASELVRCWLRNFLTVTHNDHRGDERAILDRYNRVNRSLLRQVLLQQYCVDLTQIPTSTTESSMEVPIQLEVCVTKLQARALLCSHGQRLKYGLDVILGVRFKELCRLNALQVIENLESERPLVIIGRDAMQSVRFIPHDNGPVTRPVTGATQSPEAWFDELCRLGDDASITIHDGHWIPPERHGLPLILCQAGPYLGIGISPKDAEKLLQLVTSHHGQSMALPEILTALLLELGFVNIERSTWKLNWHMDALDYVRFFHHNDHDFLTNSNSFLPAAVPWRQTLEEIASMVPSSKPQQQIPEPPRQEASAPVGLATSKRSPVSILDDVLVCQEMAATLLQSKQTLHAQLTTLFAELGSPNPTEEADKFFRNAGL